MTQLPLVCSLTTPGLRKRRDQFLCLLGVSSELRPLAQGYRVAFETDGGLLRDLAILVDAERLCCPFLRFQVTVEPNQGRTYLELTGPPGTREFLEAELGLGGQALAAGA